MMRQLMRDRDLCRTWVLEDAGWEQDNGTQTAKRYRCCYSVEVANRGMDFILSRWAVFLINRKYLWRRNGLRSSS